ncbi:MAG TPA: cyclase family protein [Longimicrobium sp.]|nr:cyclase family protein [Longimicrobium sp.]
MPPRPLVIHDITRPVFAGMPVWPGDAPCRLTWTGALAEGGANVSALSCSVHTGTHADGPYHALDDGARIGDVPLDAFIGSVHVVEAGGVAEIGAAWLDAHLPTNCERVLLRTGAWTRPDTFPARWPALTADAARLLVDRGVRLLGTDAPSPDPSDSDDMTVHRILLGAGVAIVENVMLDGIEPGEYGLIALPLRLAEADGSPIRAVLVER